MAKNDPYRPNYKKLYPNTDLHPEILTVLKSSDRKMKYIEVDIKAERFVYDSKAETASFLPSREDSYERMCEEDHAQFATNEPSPEERTIRSLEILELQSALQMLEPEEASLIQALFFEQIGERAYAKRVGISQKGVNKRRNKVLEKLRRMLTEK